VQTEVIYGLLLTFDSKANSWQLSIDELPPTPFQCKTDSFIASNWPEFAYRVSSTREKLEENKRKLYEFAKQQILQQKEKLLQPVITSEAAINCMDYNMLIKIK